VPVLRIIEGVFPLVRDILAWYPDSPGEEFIQRMSSQFESQSPQEHKQSEQGQ
jgi:hypothetical protein